MEQHPSIIPMLAYEDGIAAMEWLCRVFGFTESFRFLDERGGLAQGAIELNGGMVMIATPSPYYQSPGHHRAVCEQAKKWHDNPYIINGVLVYVDNIEAHFLTSKAMGAVILSELEYGGPGTRYRVEDLEGQRWMFMERNI